MLPTPQAPDTEAQSGLHQLRNETVQSLRWENLHISLPKKNDKVLLDGVSGMASAGELVAIMGPSGSGKTMLLNRLAHRRQPQGAKTSGAVYINEHVAHLSDIRRESNYVEQSDHLIGSITARETLLFAAKLGQHGPVSTSIKELGHRADLLLDAFGLREQHNMIIGTPIQKGLSGGQKRRVSVATQLMSGPKVLFLDEPTSGLDSVASFEIVSYLRQLARSLNILVIASIHQPSSRTFNVFDTVYLLGKGRLCYGGPVSNISSYFAGINMTMPSHSNPAEWILEIVDTDFAKDNSEGYERLGYIADACHSYLQKLGVRVEPVDGLRETPTPSPSSEVPRAPAGRTRHMLMQPVYLLQRSFIKSYRDIVAYWLRVGMYTCLALLMGTCWLRLGNSQNDVMPRTTALFFSGAFLSFMAVAYIPAYIEDQATYFKERANGLYGPLAFLTANFLIGLPYLFLIVSLFSVVAYWMVGLWPTATGFWTFVGFLFLDLLAAESLVVFISSVVPNFIVALACVAFANGLWMCTNGFLVPETVLNVFWRSWVTKIDYQNWTFRALMWNEFHQTNFRCASSGECSYPPNSDGVTIAGRSILQSYGYDSGELGAWAGYMMAIIFVYRALALTALYIRRTE